MKKWEERRTDGTFWSAEGARVVRRSFFGLRAMLCCCHLPERVRTRHPYKLNLALSSKLTDAVDLAGYEYT